MKAARMKTGMWSRKLTMAPESRQSKCKSGPQGPFLFGMSDPVIKAYEVG
jgi:hypothetical protein